MSGGGRRPAAVVPGGRKRILLTGGTGIWGGHVLHEFAARADRFEVVALVLPTARDRRVLGQFREMENLEIVFGDVTDARTVESCVRRVDHVVHLAAMVSPQADDEPERTFRVNVGGTRAIVRAVKSRPDPDAVAVVMVGSVAELGDRNPPHHWGRVGDPVRTAQFDSYGLSKVIAERELVDSGLNRWVWLRLPGIVHEGLLGIRDPIMTHVPLDGAMEWVSARDGARLLANLCEDGVPDEVWGGVHNVGGGQGWRMTNWEFHTRVMTALEVRDFHLWYDRNWFATRNFHGHWFIDSDRLEQLVPFRQQTVDAAVQQVVRAAPWSVRLASRIPAGLVKRFGVSPLMRHGRSTMAGIRDGDEARIRAYFGSREQWERIGDWSTYRPAVPDGTPRLLDHGYDETKHPREWTAQDLRVAAAFRGGCLTSDHVEPGAFTIPLRWRCAEGHDFTGSARLILGAGHWCPVCVRDPASYLRQAEGNPFLAQVERRPE